MDRHAFFQVDGILQSAQSIQFLRRNYRGTELKLEYEDEVIFCGIIKETIMKVEGGLYQIEIIAASATTCLDMDEENEMFQDVSLSYRQMLRQMVSRKSGEMISTIGEEAIEKPLLCYKETLWQYANRISSYLHNHVIADIRTGKPAFWFGLRKGKRIQEHGLNCNQIEIKKAIKKGEKDQSFYQLNGDRNYQLCDEILIEGEWQTIYEKKAYLRQGEILFTYLSTRKEALYRKEVRQKAIIGLSLAGKVERTENEQIYIRLDIDGKRGQYPFPWYPETGNGLYGMPEPGAIAELYFIESDERTAISVRCRDSEGTDDEEKRIELPDGAKVFMGASMIELNKSGKLNLTDYKLNLLGDKEIKISASGKVKVQARIIEIHAADTIDCMTDW